MKLRFAQRAAGISVSLLVFAVLANAAFGAPPDAAKLQAQISAARAALAAHLPSVSDDLRAIPGLFSRLAADSANLNDNARPPGVPESDFWAINASMVKLDTSLVDQLVTGRPHAIAGVRGTDDVVFRSAADGRLQPLGLYVPRSYDAVHSAGLVVILHGQRQSENDVVSAPGFQSLANSSGAIIAAPYARGDTQYADPAPADIYQAVGLIEEAFNIDRSHVFLCGISMGGYAVYRVGSRRPDTWSGFLPIIAGMDDRDRASALAAFKGKPVFVVVGAQDQLAGADASRAIAGALRSAGADVHYYEQPYAGHSLSDVFPSVARAWGDMFAARVTKTVAPVGMPIKASAEPIATAPPGVPVQVWTPAPKGTPP